MDKVIEELLEEWEKIKAVLIDEQRSRNREMVIERMEAGIKLFKQFLLHSNEMNQISSSAIVFSELGVKPINVAERLEFISSRPELYHSFIQLSELMVEQEKLYRKKLAMKKASRKTT